MTPREEKERRQDSVPGSLPEGTPSSYPGSDYSFTLQSVMEMQKSVGQLIQAVTTLTETSKKHDEKIDKISHRVYAASVVIAIFTAIGAFLLNKIADAVIAALKQTH